MFHELFLHIKHHTIKNHKIFNWNNQIFPVICLSEHHSLGNSDYNNIEQAHFQFKTFYHTSSTVRFQNEIMKYFKKCIYAVFFRSSQCSIDTTLISMILSHIPPNIGLIKKRSVCTKCWTTTHYFSSWPYSVFWQDERFCFISADSKTFTTAIVSIIHKLNLLNLNLSKTYLCKTCVT